MLELPAAAQVRARYPIAVVRTSPEPEAARAFVRYVRSPAADPHFTAAGFVRP